MAYLWLGWVKPDTPTAYESFIKMILKVPTEDNRKNGLREP
jgi:hypothetical protein